MRFKKKLIKRTCDLNIEVQKKIKGEGERVISPPLPKD